MSTANESRESEITGEAFELLDCFVSGLDDVIYELAESLAKTSRDDFSETVEIKREHVREAAEIVFKAIQKEAGKSIPQETVNQIKDMNRCVMEKCKILDMDD